MPLVWSRRWVTASRAPGELQGARADAPLSPASSVIAGLLSLLCERWRAAGAARGRPRVRAAPRRVRRRGSPCTLPLRGGDEQARRHAARSSPTWLGPNQQQLAERPAHQVPRRRPDSKPCGSQGAPGRRGPGARLGGCDNHLDRELGGRAASPRPESPSSGHRLSARGDCAGEQCGHPNSLLRSQRDLSGHDRSTGSEEVAGQGSAGT